MEASSLTLSRASRFAHVKASMSPAEWRRAGAMAAAIVGLHVVGFGILILLVVPQHFKLGAAGTFAIGTGITAYTLGLRHAFDADHIAAIDNTTRKMMSEGKRPLSVGFFFSLGHSTVVFALAFLLSVGVRALSGPVQNDGSTLHKATNVIGTTVSGSFLYLIAILNLLILVSVVRIFFEMRRGTYNEQELEEQLNSRGLMNRFFGRRMNKIREPWQMYPLGVLFGLGFDTATEIALLVLAAGAGAAGLPFYAILCLPILFAAGMSLLDTIDGSFMNFAYGWAFSKPVRKVYYNITITGLSVAVALFIGTIELVGLLTDKLGLHGSLVDWFQNFNVNTAGFIIVGMFVFTWMLALAVWRFARIEERWTLGLEMARARASGERD
ncbi:MAG: HoxN/HupN/NixA family nickel/cobalt transporter [Solirubrobacterales bacterium]|nr:HoxN/HupN/NixA family nickel/cobalt transporter [Solirubrobacterales bacterium]MBV9915759.1 HoxN/HupN/NixA family nickel/cobalt transporter [Solirubrobacterales bacterium]